MAMENAHRPDSSKPIPSIVKLSKFKSHFVPYKQTEVHILPEETRNKFVNVSVATANEGMTKTVRNSQMNGATLYKIIDLVHYAQDPYDPAEKQTMEGAVRRNFAVRVSLWIRELNAFKKSKLVIELPDYAKINMKDSEIQSKIDSYSKNPKVVALLKKFETRDKNLQVPLHMKKMAWQMWTFGRGCTVKLFKGDKISRLLTINSRRLAEPVLDEANNLSFEGIIIDGQGLDKSSCIYGTYQERDITPHTEGYGYSPTEPIMYVAQAHNVILEEDFNEIAKSAWLPSIVLKVMTPNMQTADKSTQISNIMDAINPGKITGVSADDVDGDPIVLDMKPDFNGLVLLADSLEAKIYNNYHIPLFYVKSDQISNVATAKKSLQAFRDGTVSDDQETIETVWGEQWYDPMLREEMDDLGVLETSADEGSKLETETSKDMVKPEDTEMPLPFVIRRRFDKPTIEDMLEQAQICEILLRSKQIDLQKANEIMDFEEELTARVEKKNAEEREQFMQEQKDMAQNGEKPNQPPNKNTKTPPTQ